MLIRPFLAALLLSIPAMTACSAQPAASSAPDLPPVPRPAGPARPIAGPEPLTPDYAVDPVAAARKAIGAKDWRLMQSWVGYAPGARCFTPDATPAGFRRQFSMLDTMPIMGDPNFVFALKYNTVILAAPEYPDADVCRPRLQGESDNPSALAPTHAGRDLARPPLSLHEAARRGSITDLRRFLPVTQRNQVDWFGMTPLAWAAARGRSDIWTELVRNGEVPVAAVDSQGRDDLYWAIASGREAIVTAIIAYTRGELREPLRSTWLNAAISSGNPRIVDQVFALPHRRLEMDTWTAAKWQLEAVEAALKRSDASTAEYLMRIASATNPPRDDLKRLAARYAGQAVP